MVISDGFICVARLSSRACHQLPASRRPRRTRQGERARSFARRAGTRALWTGTGGSRHAEITSPTTARSVTRRLRSAHAMRARPRPRCPAARPSTGRCSPGRSGSQPPGRHGRTRDARVHFGSSPPYATTTSLTTTRQSRTGHPDRSPLRVLRPVPATRTVHPSGYFVPYRPPGPFTPPGTSSRTGHPDRSPLRVLRFAFLCP